QAWRRQHRPLRAQSILIKICTFVCRPQPGSAGGQKTETLPLGGESMSATELPAHTLSELDHRAHLRRAMIASTVGTTIEWYDFLLYGQVTALVFGKLF